MKNVLINRLHLCPPFSQLTAKVFPFDIEHFYINFRGTGLTQVWKIAYVPTHVNFWIFAPSEMIYIKILCSFFLDSSKFAIRKLAFTNRFSNSEFSFTSQRRQIWKRFWRKRFPQLTTKLKLKNFWRRIFTPVGPNLKLKKELKRFWRRSFPQLATKLKLKRFWEDCWTDFEEEVSPQLDPNWSWKDFEKILKGFWNYFEISWNDYWTDFEGKVFSLFGNQIEVKNKILKRFWRKVPPKLATKLKLTGVSRPDGEMASADVCLEINPGKEKRNRSRKGKKK